MKFEEIEHLLMKKGDFVTVFGKKGCMQCKMTHSILIDGDVNVQYIDIDDVENGREFIQHLGYQALPVVILDNGTMWSGFQPELINDVVDAGLWNKPNPQWMKRNKMKDGEIR